MAELRARLLDDTALWNTLSMVEAVNPHYALRGPVRDSLGDAALWWIGGDCCDLLASAAPSMPPVTLTADLVPDLDGFVFFANPLEGMDAEHPGRSVSITAMQWQPSIVGGLACVSIVMWSDALTTLGLPFMPLGRADWPYGHATDHPIPNVTPAAEASIVEDRRLLAALWQLSSQPDLISSTDTTPNRPAARRLRRRGHEPGPVRIVSLNQRTHRATPTPASPQQGREYTHRWIVQAHWRQQAYGPGRTLRRARYIPTHVKGPADKPLQVRDSVKVWTRP